jgi:hypothetical protein
MRPQLSTRSNLHVRKVLLIDQATREARAAILRSHSVEVHEATEMTHAHYLWRPNVYGLVMLDVRRSPRGRRSSFTSRFGMQVPDSASCSSSGLRGTSRVPGLLKPALTTALGDSGRKR